MDDTLSPALATGFNDTQLNNVLLQLGIGAEPSLVREQAELAFTALTRRAKR